MSAPLNLATRPLRNEKLPALLLGVAITVLLAVTVQHVLVIRRLLPSRTAAGREQVAALDRELEQLRAQAGPLRRPKPPEAVVKRWALLKGLVDRRAFSWTDLFADLEHVMPPGVRLLSIAPDLKGGEVKLQLEAMTRSGEDGLTFFGILQKRPEFADATILGIGSEEEGGAAISYEMKYQPSPREPRP